MATTLIGYITMLLVGLGLFVKAESVAIILCVLSMLVAAAALFIGPLTINPALLFLPLFILKAGVPGRQWNIGASGYTLLLFLLYSFLITIFSPRIFEGSIKVYWTTRELFGSNDTVPLKPMLGNVTQSCYAIAAALCFFSALITFQKKKEPSL